MGSPTSSLIDEIFLQNLEQTVIKHVLDTNNIDYDLPVDDVLIIFNSIETTANGIKKINIVH
jgi:hypothetical protein